MRAAKRVLVTGSMGGNPPGYGGHSWAVLQYILGFRRLGLESYYVERLKPDACVDTEGRPASFADSVAASYFHTLIERFDLAGYAALLEWEGSGHIGLSHREVDAVASDIDLMINRSGQLQLESILKGAKKRLYLDVDPGYTQVWQAQYGVDMNLRGHDVYVTVGLNFGAPDCPFPSCGIDWKTTLPPVVIDEWTTAIPPGLEYTTVADWRGYGSVEWQGEWYGQKADEFLRVVDLPRRVAVPLSLCLLIDPKESGLPMLKQHGWRIVSPLDHVSTPDRYREYICRSRGEFTVVKHGYAAGRTGWFSDRSACYLAAGRPVIVQETGISSHVPTGIGLLTFTDIESAAEAIAQVERDYARHAPAAAAFAREHLDSDRVLSRLLQLAGV
ncbi:MAG: hypothetical protein AB7G75_03395 [Candidatus Binatia bacterium]